MADMSETERHWNEIYGDERRWSGRVNVVLAELVEQAEPGAALDLGTGEGGDAVWLAQRGWRVTSVDVSSVALDRARETAEEQGVLDRIEFRHQDLVEEFPDGSYDLVSAQFLQTTLEFPRIDILRRAAAAVRSGGMLVVVEHGSMPEWSTHPEPAGGFPVAEQTLDELELDDGWEPVLVGARDREVEHGGHSGVIADSVVALRRSTAQAAAVNTGR